jgi:hypothetical protein
MLLHKQMPAGITPPADDIHIGKGANLNELMPQAEAATKPGPGEYQPEVTWDTSSCVFGTSVRTLEDNIKELML